MANHIEIIAVAPLGGSPGKCDYSFILTGSPKKVQSLQNEQMETGSLESPSLLKLLKERSPDRVMLQWGGAVGDPETREGGLLGWLPKMRAAGVRAFMGSTTSLHQAVPSLQVSIPIKSEVDWMLTVACVAAGLRTNVELAQRADADAIRVAVLERALRVRPKCLRDIEATMLLPTVAHPNTGEHGNEDFTQEDYDRLTGRLPMKIVRDVAKPLPPQRYR